MFGCYVGVGDRVWVYGVLYVGFLSNDFYC